MKDLLKDIKTKLGIEGGLYVDAEIETYIEKLEPHQHLEFFMALSGEHNFAKPMDRLANVAKRFTDTKEDEVFSHSRQLAKSMYEKFYDQHSQMTTFTQRNRNSNPNDMTFFIHTNYDKLKQSDGANVYTKQELFVMDELGGGNWLYGIKRQQTSTSVIDKIERVIKDALSTKYLDTPKQEKITHDVSKLMIPKKIYYNDTPRKNPNAI